MDQIGSNKSTHRSGTFSSSPSSSSTKSFSLFEWLSCFPSHESNSKNNTSSSSPSISTDVQVQPSQAPSTMNAVSGGVFKRVFEHFDTNGDGKISPSELRTCLRTVGEEATHEEVEAVVESSDSDGDGMLGYDDFVKLIDVEGDEKISSLREAFSMYETEEGGGITPRSLKRMLGRLGESKTIEQCTDMIRRFDLDSDGVINFDEFKIMML